MLLLIETAGWAGALLVLGAYLLVSSGRVSGASPLFQWMNLLGSALFVLNTWWHGAIPSMVLNIVWSGIALAALWRVWRSKSLDAQ